MPAIKGHTGVICSKVKVCSSLLSKAIGLMFSRKRDDFGLVMKFKHEGYHSIHMLFVFYPIDVVWLDENKKVVDMKENVRPFSLSIKPDAKAAYIIELPEGHVLEKGIMKGMALSF